MNHLLPINWFRVMENNFVFQSKGHHNVYIRIQHGHKDPSRFISQQTAIHAINSTIILNIIEILFIYVLILSYRSIANRHLKTAYYIGCASSAKCNLITL